MTPLFLILAGYGALIYETGAAGVVLAGIHIGLMLLATRAQRSRPQ